MNGLIGVYANSATVYSDGGSLCEVAFLFPESLDIQDRFIVILCS